MDFNTLIKTRYSCRSYQPVAIEEEKLYKVLEAGRLAPSACNNQPWHFIVTRNSEILEKLYSCYDRNWFKSAKTIITICGDHSISWKRADGKDHCDIDIAIAVDHMTLQAAELGLATCWVCNFDKEKCSKILNLPENIEPIAILPIGYPADSVDIERHSLKRKKLEDIVHREVFGER